MRLSKPRVRSEKSVLQNLDWLHRFPVPVPFSVLRVHLPVPPHGKGAPRAMERVFFLVPAQNVDQANGDADDINHDEYQHHGQVIHPHALIAFVLPVGHQPIFLLDFAAPEPPEQLHADARVPCHGIATAMRGNENPSPQQLCSAVRAYIAQNNTVIIALQES